VCRAELLIPLIVCLLLLLWKSVMAL